jgi:tRNA(Ile)-lysidine synthase
MALMLLAAGWAAPRRVALRVATVDHGLRPEAAAEAARVAARAAALGLPHDALRWTAPGRGNLMAAARDGRRALLGAWAARHGLSAVALGHNADDQAETALMALARGGALDALAAMPEAARRDGTLWLRPLLGASRAALRRWLAARGEAWDDDPSNEDDRFERVRARRALAALAPLGLDARALCAAAAAAARARAALEAATDALAAAALSRGALGEARLARGPLAAAPDEIALRLLGRGLDLARGRPVAPRAQALAPLLSALRAAPSGRRTLCGCAVSWRGASAAICRETAALPPAPDGDLWDHRFVVSVSAPGSVRALGEAGLAALAAAARAGVWTPPAAWSAAPRAARLAAPALWREESLACAPLAGYGHGLVVRSTGPRADSATRRVEFGDGSIT